jgi:hypothetical protein
MTKGTRTILRGYIKSLVNRLEQAQDSSREARERIVAEILSMAVGEALRAASNEVLTVSQEVSNLARDYKSEET